MDSSVIKLHEGWWYTNFKNEVFIQCLKRLYPKNFSTFFDSLDASSTANTDQLDFNTEVLKIADSIAGEFVKGPESSWTIENKKIVMNICMGYRNSEALDAVSVFFYKRFHPIKEKENK
jgi:hypothetical protein